jgi:hypothetical protein
MHYQNYPREVAALKNIPIKQIAVGNRHSVFLTSDSTDVYLSGFGHDYPRKVLLFPKPANSVKYVKPIISSIAAGMLTVFWN